MIGMHWFPLRFNHCMDTQVDTRRLILFQFLQVTYSHRHSREKNPHTVFTIVYHYVVREVKIMLPIKVIWLSFAHHWVSIYISSCICFECHWAVPRNSTLKPIGNVHDSFLLPAWLTIPEMFSLISPGYMLPYNHSTSYSHSASFGIHLFPKYFVELLIPFPLLSLCTASS